MIKERIKLRFATEIDQILVRATAGAQGLSVEELVHKLLHKEVVVYLDKQKDSSAIGDSSCGEKSRPVAREGNPPLGV